MITRARKACITSFFFHFFQSVLRKMHPNDAPLISDPIMQALLQMLKSHGGKGGAVQEDALVAIGTLVEGSLLDAFIFLFHFVEIQFYLLVLGLNFCKYVDHVLPFVYAALNNHAEYQICAAAVGVVADLSRALTDKLTPYCDQIMQHLLTCLNNDKLHRTVKPQILSAFGDIALAIGIHFQKYLEHVLNTLGQACRAQVAKNDYDMIEYLNELREACLTAYTGIIQGLRNSVRAGTDGNTSQNPGGPPELQMITNQLPFIISFLEAIARDSNKSENLVGGAIGLIGDLVTSYGQAVLPYIDREPFEKLFAEGKRSKLMKTKTLANWATKEIRKLKSN